MLKKLEVLLCSVIIMIFPMSLLLKNAPLPTIWLIGKDFDAGRDWGQEEKGMTEGEMAGWFHWLDGHEFEWTPGDGQGGLACCGSWGRKELDTTERMNWTELKPSITTITIGMLNCKVPLCDTHYSHTHHLPSIPNTWQSLICCPSQLVLFHNC